MAEQFREKLRNLCAMMNEAANDVLASTGYPQAPWPQIYSTNPLGRPNAEIKRRTSVVDILPNDSAMTLLVGA
ncbi:transposase [Roseateles sp. BYS96W]|uniref:Transposase n=1 Tax=Pelomonas nitida TaxID=3299027 RepID=A0ABW7G1I4_9BURK